MRARLGLDPARKDEINQFLDGSVPLESLVTDWEPYADLDTPADGSLLYANKAGECAASVPAGGLIEPWQVTPASSRRPVMSPRPPNTTRLSGESRTQFISHAVFSLSSSTSRIRGCRLPRRGKLHESGGCGGHGCPCRTEAVIVDRMTKR